MAHAAITKEKNDGFEVIRPDCGTVGSADEEELADLVARLHADSTRWRGRVILGGVMARKKSDGHVVKNRERGWLRPTEVRHPFSDLRFPGGFTDADHAGHLHTAFD